MKALLPMLTLILAACGGPGPAENQAQQLENAAEQSRPAAAEALENAAQRIEDGIGQDAYAETNLVLEQAGEVAANQQ